MNKKTYEKITRLNRVYTPLINRAERCRQLLQDRNKASAFVWANAHFESYKGKYICEKYPIPVVEIEGIGDIGFNINGCFYEGYFSKEDLLNFDYEIIRDIKSFALYGENDYLNDIYNYRMNFDEIKELIENSAQTNIAISFAFKYKDIEQTLDALILLTSSRACS